MQYSCWKDRIENLSDEKTTSDAEPSDLVREASVSVSASLCIVGTNTTILILVETITIILILGTKLVLPTQPSSYGY